jgi:hypothetical protein
VNNQFGGYDEKYRKYKGKYLALKKQYFGTAPLKGALQSDHGLTVQGMAL